MNDDTQLLTDTAMEAFARHRDGADAWQAIEQLGLTGIGVPEHLGGSGGTADDARIVLRAAAYHGVALPIAETLWLAAPLLAAARLPIPAGPLTVAEAVGGDVRVHANPGDSSFTLSGRLRRVPWARLAARVVVATTDRVCLVDPLDCRIEVGVNLAGEPRDDLVLDGVRVSADDIGPLPYRMDLRARGALARSIQICGAAQHALDLSVRYSGERVQFGRPIAAFQAVQQYLAQMAGEVAIADVSVSSAVTTIDGRPDDAPMVVAAARVDACRAAGVVAELSHQVHGSIGTTREHDLHRATTRLWSWRDEFGNETEWSRVLGALADPDPWTLIAG